jgi:membrane-bound lytic murein transglycosylase MltF
MRTWLAPLLPLTLAATLSAQAPAKPAQPAKAPPAQPAKAPPPQPASPAAGLPLELPRFTGDYDQMLKRRMMRVGVAYNRTHYFIDRGVQRGIAYEFFKKFEDEVNASIKQPKDRFHVVFVPMSRDEMTKALLEGRVDVISAGVTITPERRKIADFSDPTRADVSEIVVTGPGAPSIKTLADLAGQEVLVREGSTYHQNLQRLNGEFKAQKRPEMRLRLAPLNLEDDDILEMVNAGIAKITVVDNYLAEFWVQVFTGLTLHREAALTTNGEIAVAMRPNSPQLKAAANAFLKRNGKGTAFGNVVLKRYLASTRYVKNAVSDAERKRFETMVEFFRKYGGQYKLDYLLMAAQGFQESGLNQDVKSPVGAIGVMQVMPATGKDLNVGDITQMEPNIHAGVKYIRFMIDQYFKSDPMDDLNKGLMAFASYNAGPNRIRQLRAEARKRGLNENVWFNNVEQIVSERIGRETVTYVSNIYKYYIAYKLSMEQREERSRLRGQ